MNKKERGKLPLKYKSSGILLFGGLTLVCLFSFPKYIYNLIDGMVSFQPIIQFSKGDISVGGLGLSCFSSFMLVLFAEKISPKMLFFSFQVMFYGLLISIISPYLMMFWVDHFVEENHYTYCEAISDHEGKYWTTVYTKTIDICQIETAKVRGNKG
ncbi:hypothetical protein VA7868_00922 [Vibrio aerogenes CECT 7868]|uniref:Uncharacterized protein n=1 Tax=Vibrio aerogenes CECT 7868 TaxID=1216006 RepID=A0A1M5WYN2_9VIBR|nr:hypothetical protein [Vibrio aerogenes]SHH92452.1 hypothetical protein VA7868_00922 [Vibrio aerogenes CECT 7868]